MPSGIGITRLQSVNQTCNAGKHVLLEKPMATSLEDCDRLLEAAARNNQVLTIGHELRLSAQWGEIQKILQRGDIGRPQYANFSLFRFPFRSGADNWRHKRS